MTLNSLLMLKDISKILLLILLFGTCIDLTAGVGEPLQAEHRALLFSGGDSISRFYRIPALATLPSGRIVAVADRRLDSNKDLPARIDIVCRYSDDNGTTWSDARPVVLNDAGGGYGDPALGVAPNGDLVCVMTHGNGVWESIAGDFANIYACRSTDDGQTWSEPVNITPSLFSQTEGEAPVQSISAFATSGRILTDSKGTMWFVLVARQHDEKWSNLTDFVCKSDDGGLTWTINPVGVDTDGDEAKIVECADVSLLMSIRNRRKGYRKFSRSTDHGNTWTLPQPSTTLPDPACNGDILKLADGTLLQSINDDHEDRYRVSIFASNDSGETWRKLCEVCPVRSAYSALTLMKDGKLGVLTEEASTLGGLRLWFSRYDLDTLLKQ